MSIKGFAVFILSLSILTAIFQVNLGYPVFIEAKDDEGDGDSWTTGTISRAKLQCSFSFWICEISWIL